MDILILLALILIAGAMLLGKPLQITVVHKIDQPPIPELDEEAKQKIEEDQKVAAQTFNSVLQAVHDIMGVNDDGKDNSRT